MNGRSFFVRLNLDDMSDSLDSLDSTEERGLWVEGFRIGSRGKPSREGWAGPKMIGYEFGLQCWNSAQVFREKQSLKGIRSSDLRRKSTTVEPEVNHGSTAVQPEVNLSRSQKLEARSEDRRNEERARDARDPSPRDKIPVTDFHPNQGHRSICGLRNLNLEAQFARFAGQATGTDTTEGWDNRLMQWLAKGFPERAPIMPFTPPTAREWETEAEAYASKKPPFRDDPGYFWPCDLAMAKWNEHQANVWARVLDWKAQLHAECDHWTGWEIANRKRPAR